MANIKFEYDQIESVATKLDSYAQEYESAGKTLVDSLLSSTGQWKGASKEKFEIFVNDAVSPHVQTSIPQLVRDLAKLLRDNATAMREADEQMAGQIPNSL